MKMLLKRQMLPVRIAQLQGDEFDRRVEEAQVRLLYDQLPTAVAASVVGTLLFAAIMWTAASRTMLLTWAALMLANQTWRLVLYAGHRRKASLTPREVVRWGTYWAVGSGISGCLWGAATFLFFDENSAVMQTMLIVSIFAVTSAAVLLIGAHLPSFYAFVLPALTPIIIRNVMQGEETHLLLALIAAIATLGIVAFGRNYNAALVQSLRSRFENEALARALGAQNKALEQARRTADKARSEAEVASRSKTQFFAAASHDLRQPLHALGLFAAALAEKVHDPDVTNVVRSINASVISLETLFSELLDLSRIDAGVIKVNRRHFAVKDIFDRLRLDFEPEAAERGLSLRIRATSLHADSDPLLVERILRNLVANALRYTRRGGILVAARKRGARVAIEVWDTGIGIARDEQERVFDEFYQVGNPERDRKKGLGLGLSIVKRLVALIGADLALRSEPGRGTCFRITVPRGTRRPESPIPANAPASVFGALNGRVIVVIEDEMEILEGMRVLLVGWGAQVIGTASVDEALSATRTLSRAPDLVIADYRLGSGLDGSQAIEALRARFATSIPAILVTGSTTPAHLDEAKAKGFHVLNKPVAPAKLRSLINFKLGSNSATGSSA